MKSQKEKNPHSNTTQNKNCRGPQLSKKDNYRIITSATDRSREAKTVTGGVAIMVRESKQQNIVQIKRQGSRAIRVTLDQDTAAMPIHIISTYAPHSGHSEETRLQH